MLLIILRGPAGCGKSKVYEGLKNKLSIGTCFLNLDEINKEPFEKNIENALEYECVIGEMFYGNGHTTNPVSWIKRFNNKDYKIFSFILKASIETCLQRCRNDNKNKRSYAYQEYNQHKLDHYKFYNCSECVNFAKNANIDEEIIDTETKSIEEVVDIIFSKIKSYLT